MRGTQGTPLQRYICTYSGGMDGSPPAFSCKWIQCGSSGLMQGLLTAVQRETAGLCSGLYKDAKNRTWVIHPFAKISVQISKII